MNLEIKRAWKPFKTSRGIVEKRRQEGRDAGGKVSGGVTWDMGNTLLSRWARRPRHSLPSLVHSIFRHPAIRVPAHWIHFVHQIHLILQLMLRHAMHTRTDFRHFVCLGIAVAPHVYSMNVAGLPRSAVPQYLLISCTAWFRLGVSFTSSPVVQHDPD